MTFLWCDLKNKGWTHLVELPICGHAQIAVSEERVLFERPSSETMQGLVRFDRTALGT